MTVPLTELYRLITMSSLEGYYNTKLFLKTCGDKYLVWGPFCLWRVLPLAAGYTNVVQAQTVALCYCQDLHCCQVPGARPSPSPSDSHDLKNPCVTVLDWELIVEIIHREHRLYLVNMTENPDKYEYFPHTHFHCLKKLSKHSLKVSFMSVISNTKNVGYNLSVISPYLYLLPWHISSTHDIMPASIKINTDIILH